MSKAKNKPPRYENRDFHATLLAKNDDEGVYVTKFFDDFFAKYMYKLRKRERNRHGHWRTNGVSKTLTKKDARRWVEHYDMEYTSDHLRPTNEGKKSARNFDWALLWGGVVVLLLMILVYVFFV